MHRFAATSSAAFLRPDVLKQARADFNAGIIDAAQLKTVEDVAIRDLVAKQKAAGLQGGDRWRVSSQLLAPRLHVGPAAASSAARAARAIMFHDEETTADTRGGDTGPISGENHPFVEHFKFVKALAGDDHVARQTIPAPIQTFSEVTLDRCDGQQESLRSVYPDRRGACRGHRCRLSRRSSPTCTPRVAAISSSTTARGASTATPTSWRKRACSPVDIQKVSELGVALNNAAIEGAPEDLVINTHVCRGNYHSTYAFEGGYDPVAPYLFAHENVNAFYLEFDTPRAGGFEPLAHVAEGKKVVLGLITSKQPGLEDKEVVTARIKEAARSTCRLRTSTFRRNAASRAARLAISSPRKSSGRKSLSSKKSPPRCGRVTLRAMLRECAIANDFMAWSS